MTRMDGMERLTEERFKTSQLAINKAEQAQELRNQASNEWRNAMKDREAIFATKTEMQRNTEDIKSLQSFKDNLMGKNTIIAIVIPVLISLAFLILNRFIN